MTATAPHLSRRRLFALTGGLAAAGVVLDAPRASAAPSGSGCAGGVRAAHAFLRTMANAYPSVSPPTLPQSYADELGLFSSAFVYDASLAICAALALGDTRLARRIGDGLVFAQANDPTHPDGRLRQAYNVGPYTFYDGNPSPYGLKLPDGTANIGWQFGFLGTAVGDMAWPGIALVRLYRATRKSTYRDAAVRIGRWIVDNATNAGSLGGFSFGVDGANQRLTNAATEHNIDCASFFTQLAAIDRSSDWCAQAAKARSFVRRMWSGRYFWTGSNDGSTINKAIVPLDPQAWTWLTWLDRRYAEAPVWAAQNLWTTDDASQPLSQLPDGVSISGVTFTDASLASTASYNGIQVNPKGVWLEGNAQLALALSVGGSRHRRTARTLLDNLRRAQRTVGGGQHVGGADVSGGIVAASSLLDSGFGYGYFQVQHVGATAWYIMAERRYNPMR